MMIIKRTSIICLFLLSNLIFAQSSREKILFDDNWKFHSGDISKAKETGYKDSLWRSINLPHDWSIEADFNSNYASCTGYLPGGFGWYRKTFEVPVYYKEKTITIQFDGVYCNSEVWINGKYLRKHPYGYSSFYYNLTPYLDFGKQNMIAVRVDHMKYADTRWYSGSGIYRHVWLTVTDKIHVAQWGSFVLTPEINPSLAKVTVETVIANDEKVTENIKLLSSVLNKDGKEVASAETQIQLSDSITPVKQSLNINNPVLWDIENPYMYKVHSKIISGKTVIDEYETPFGIRTIKFDANKGFYLNGKNMKLKGVCLHHDGGCVGAAVPEKIWRIRLEKLKAAGCNAIRTSHNPVAPEFLDLCDQLGFLVMDEAFDEWEYPKRKWIDGWNQTKAGFDGYPDIFDECAEKDLYNMVYRDKNHPSIIIWSIGNEVDYKNDPYTDPESDDYLIDRPDVSRMVEIAKKFSGIVKSIDTSRPVTMAMANVATSNKVDLPGVLDISGYNYTENAYMEDHEKYPERIIYGSENSHNYSSWLAVKNNDFISAQFLWTGVDYLGEAGRYPIHAATSGLLDLTSNEKPIYYWRQAMWSDKPMLYLTARKKRNNDRPSNDPMSRLSGFLNSSDQNEHWNYKEGDTVLVMAFTNCSEAELFVNGKSAGIKKQDPASSCLWWYVNYVPGEVKVTAKGSDNKTLTSKLIQIFEPEKIVLTPDVTQLKANNQDIAVVEVQLQDKNNNRSVIASNLINFEISGEGRIIGVDNGDASSLENYKSPKRKAHAGRCIVIVQSTGKSGIINLKASSEGLQDTTIEITSD